MPKCGQMRVGASWVGGKEPDLIAPGRLRFYDKRCRTRIILGATVRAHIAKNSIWRVQRGNGFYGTKRNKVYQYHYKYFRNIGAPGSQLQVVQNVMKQAMQEVKILPEPVRNMYRAMAKAYFLKYRGHPGIYRARAWPHFYLIDRLPQLYAALP